VTAALINPVTLVLAGMCIQWVTLGSIGPFSVKLPYLMLSLAMIYAASSSSRLRACSQFVRQNAAWIAPFAVYIVLLTVALYRSDGQNMPLRQIFYFVGTTAFAGSLAMTREPRSIIRIGASVAIALFIIVVEILARRIGLSWLDAISAFIRGGDLQFVIYRFFRPVFNSLDPDVTVVASQKNAIAVCVLTAALLFRCASRHPWRDAKGAAVLVAALVLLLLLNTRSVLIVAGVSIVLATLMGAVMRPQHATGLLLKGLTAVALVVIAVGYTQAETPALDTMSDRFSFEDQSTASRVQQYEAAVVKIKEHPLIGNGYFELDGKPIHNLFLSSWVHAGLAAFILVLAFYLALLGRWLSILLTVITYPERWVIPIAFEWIAPLPILPLFRVWLSGDGGHLFLGEWLALSAFLGIVLANDLKRRSLARRLAVAVRTAPIEPASIRPAM
jgi:O-antigen ligase